MIQVSGGSIDAGGRPRRVITLPVTVDPVAVKDGECSFEPAFFEYYEEHDEPELAKFKYEVVEPQDEANRGRRVKITAQSDGGYGNVDVPWISTISMICPGRRCSISLSRTRILLYSVAFIKEFETSFTN